MSRSGTPRQRERSEPSVARSGGTLRARPKALAPDAAQDPAPRRRPGGRNAEVRDAVRRAALELLSEGGFGAVTLPAVARRAGVHKTTVYRSWSSPTSLVEGALSELEALALPDIDTGSFRGDVEAFVAARVRLIREPRAAAILRAVIGARSPHPALYAWVETFWKPRRRGWRSPIERAIERGELAPSARTVPLVELVAGPLLLAHLATRRRVAARELDAITSTLVAGVLARHGPTRPRAHPKAGTRPRPSPR